MFDREKFKDIIAEKDRMSWADREDDYRMSKLWREMTDKDIQKAGTHVHL